MTPNRGAVPGTSAYVRNNYIVTGGTLVTPTDKWSVKGDQMIGDKQRLSFLWNMTTFRNKPGPAGPPGLPDSALERSDSGLGHRSLPDCARLHDHASMVNHFSWFKNSFRKDSFSGATGRTGKTRSA